MSNLKLLTLTLLLFSLSITFTTCYNSGPVLSTLDPSSKKVTRHLQEGDTTMEETETTTIEGENGEIQSSSTTKTTFKNGTQSTSSSGVISESLEE
jgi:hypothetical protein